MIMKQCTMLMVSATTQNKKGEDVPTFKLIPISKDCPFNEAIFDPNKLELGVISKEKYQSVRMIPRVDVNGEPMTMKRDGVEKYKTERVILDNFYDYTLSSQTDIQNFVFEMAGEDSFIDVCNRIDEYYPKGEELATQSKDDGENQQES